MVLHVLLVRLAPALSLVAYWLVVAWADSFVAVA